MGFIAGFTDINIVVFMLKTRAGLTTWLTTKKIEVKQWVK